MKIKVLKVAGDFIPMIKEPSFWVAKEPLQNGSVFEVPDDLGWALLSQYNVKGAKVLEPVQESEKMAEPVQDKMSHGTKTKQG